MNQQNYQAFPFLTKNRFFSALIGYITFMLLPAYTALQPTGTELHQAAGSLAVFFTVIHLEYFVFFIIPYVLFIRKTGRYLYLRRVGRYYFQPFAPFYDEPSRYGATRYKTLISFVASVVLLALFILIVAAPTVAILFTPR